MLSWIESGAKAFTVTIEVPVKIRQKIIKIKLEEKENFKAKQEQTLGIYYLPSVFSFVHCGYGYIQLSKLIELNT